MSRLPVSGFTAAVALILILAGIIVE